MGFKPRSSMKPYFHIKPAQFIYPDEGVSTQTFGGQFDISVNINLSGIAVSLFSVVLVLFEHKCVCLKNLPAVKFTRKKDDSDGTVLEPRETVAVSHKNHSCFDKK